MGTRTSRARRGQALVETALGSMVFVTILLFGIYFAEVSALTLKVQEAANFALWESTGHVMHDPQAGNFQLPDAVGLARSEAQARYRDFDGRAGHDGDMTLQLAIARARGMDVQCDSAQPAGSNDGILGSRPVDASGSGSTAGSPALDDAMRTQSAGIGCTASATLGAERIGTFLEPEFFKTSHRRATDQFIVCAAGRASNGVCRRTFFMLLDDWGLAGLDEGRSCGLNRDGAAVCQNPDYFEWAKAVYDKNGGGGSAGRALMAGVGAPGAVDEGQFFMSFRGQETQYQENIGASHAGNQSIWETTPFVAKNLPLKYDINRRGKWLGGVPH